MATKKCGKCGANNPDNANYCGKCGRALSSIEYEVDPKGSRRSLRALEDKYVEHPSMGTGFAVLWKAMKRPFGRIVIPDVVSSILTIILWLVGVVAIMWISFAFADRNSVDKYSLRKNADNYALYKKDKRLTPYIYDTLFLYRSFDNVLTYVVAKNGGKYGRLDNKGHVLDSCIYDSISPFSNGWAITSSNGLYGFIKENKTGIIRVIEPQYLSAYPFSDGFARVQYKDKTFGWIDVKGHEVPWGRVIQCGDYHDGWAWTTTDKAGKEFEFVDRKGNLTSFHATSITFFNGERAFVSQGKGWAMLDPKMFFLTDFVLYPRIDPATKQYSSPLFPYEANGKQWRCSYNGVDCYVNKKGEITGLSSTSASAYALQAEGIGPIRLGAIIKKLPKATDGLYDKIVAEKVEEFDYEGTVYHLVLQGVRIASLIEDGGKIHAIEVLSDKWKTEDGIGIQNTVIQILSAGATSYCDNYGFEGLLLKGMLFSGMDLTASGQKKAEVAYLEGTDQVFTKSDFKTGTRPTKITLAKWYAESTK